MEIKENTIYHVPTEELRKDFLTKCEEKGFKWNDGSTALSDVRFNVYDSELCINTSNGRMMYADRGHYKIYSGYPIITWEIDKPKPTIIKLPNNHKIVVNKPYTIYTDGKVTGKAKCNPEDEWNTEVGIQVAVVRYKTNRQLEDLLESVKPLSSYINPLNLQPKTIQERFPIGSKVEMVKKSGEPWTSYEIGTLAKVTGYTEDGTVYCDFKRYRQMINPDDLRLING